MSKSLVLSHTALLAILLSLSLAPTRGAAQDMDTDGDGDATTDDSGPSVVGDGRAPEAYPDAAGSPDGDDAQLRVVDQAGVGSDIAYGRPGVVELGGYLAMNWTERAFSLDIAPSVGVFVLDNFQISGFFGLRYINASDGTSVRTDSTSLLILVEPSYHLPLSNQIFLFAGLGLGAQYNGIEAGFAIAPRIGMNFLLGRSGILSPAIRASWITGAESAVPTLDVLVAYTIML